MHQMIRVVKLMILLLLLLVAISSAIYGAYWLFYIGNVKNGLSLFWLSTMAFLGVAALYFNIKGDNVYLQQKEYYYQGYTFNENGWSIWPFKKIYFKWSDIDRIVTRNSINGYFTVIKYFRKNAIDSLELRAPKQFKFLKPASFSGYCKFIKYACEMLPPEKVCLVTLELAGYDPTFKKDKYHQSELAYQENMVRQLWLELKSKQALKICNEILEKAPDNFWGMKIKACIAEDISTTISIFEKMIALKYYDQYVIGMLIALLILQKADSEKVDNYMKLFREYNDHVDFNLEFYLLNYYLDTFKDFHKADALLKKLEVEAGKRADPVYMKNVKEFHDKIARLNAR